MKGVTRSKHVILLFLKAPRKLQWTSTSRLLNLGMETDLGCCYKSSK